jgi:hypothetical protein
MPSLADDQKRMRRRKGFEDSLAKAMKEEAQYTGKSFDGLLDRLYRHERIGTKTMRRLRGGPDKRDWNDGHQFFTRDRNDRLYDMHGAPHRHGRGRTKRKTRRRRKRTKRRR